MRVIAHADMDAFYASVEQRDRPELRGLPVIVGGTGTRGVVAAASYEARRFGVRSAMPSVEARRRCPQAVFLPGRMSVYADVSRQIRAVFTEITPAIEPLSLDEAFLDLSGTERLHGSPREVAERIRRRVREETDLAVSVGIGPSKMIAKIASDLAKPDGLLLVPADEVRDFLAPLPIRRLWGAGPKTCASLEAIGVRSFGDLLASDPARLARAVGNQAEHLRRLAAGDDEREVVVDGRRKSYGEENTFSGDERDGPELRRTIVAHAEAVARRLRLDARSARTIVLKFRLAQRSGPGQYPLRTRSHSLESPTDDGKTIADVALDLWSHVPAGTKIRLVGVAVQGLVDGAEGQLDLFAAPVQQQRKSLNLALDAIAERHGEGAVRRGGARVERAAPTHSIKEKES